MNRRTFLRTAMLGAFTVPVAAQAQQARKAPRVGVLMYGSSESRRAVLEAFRQGLRDLGYSEGRNIVIEYRFGEGDDRRLHEPAAELVRLNVDVIVTSGVPGALAAKRATTKIPIVVGQASDLVGAGLVDSLARPGGNVTGIDSLTAELSGKRLELIKELLPKLSRAGVLWNQRNPGAMGSWETTQAAARAARLELLSLPIQHPDDLEGAFATAMRASVDALVVIQDALTIAHSGRITLLAAKSRLPAVYGSTQFVEAGGLIGYGADVRDNYRHAAIFVDKILKGAKPADLPVEQPTKFELVINLKTAKALGLPIPPSLLLRADQVIE